jgi:ADP-ribosylation factor GTPase-activating protein 2/3
MGVHVTFVRSCDLDEWTQGQLDIMKLGGNGNAKQFFKKHGVTEAQMGSEKKYSTKAASMYKNHLTKIVSEEVRTRSDSFDSPKAANKKPSTWESATGLDNLMKSVSGSGLDELDNEKETEKSNKNENEVTKSTEPVSVFKAPEPVKAPPAAIYAPVVVQKEEPKAKGTLSVASNASSSSSSTEIKPMKIIGAKKTFGKKLGARKLVGVSGAIKMDSFDDVEKRTIEIEQERDDHALAIKMHNAEIGDSGSSRLNAIYADSESIYKAPVTKQPNSYSSGGASSMSMSPMNNYGGSIGSQGHIPNTVPNERADTNKFSSNKGISSDAYFGRDVQDDREVQAQLARFKNSSAIGSDMLNGRSDNYDNYDGFDVSEGLKNQVKGFFDSVQNM